MPPYPSLWSQPGRCLGLGAEPPTASARGRNLPFPHVRVTGMPAGCQGGGFPGNRQAGVAEAG